MGFNSLVLEVAIIILIICLVMIGWGIYQSVYGSDAKFPPVISQCPDYWSMDTEMKGKNKIIHCNNTLKMGKGAAESGNPKCNSFEAGTVSSDCEKLGLSTICNITWDGISDNPTIRHKCTTKNN